MNQDPMMRGGGDNIWQRATALALTGALAVGIAGCGDSPHTSERVVTTPVPTETTPRQTAPPENTPKSNVPNRYLSPHEKTEIATLVGMKSGDLPPLHLIAHGGLLKVLKAGNTEPLVKLNEFSVMSSLVESAIDTPGIQTLSFPTSTRGDRKLLYNLEQTNKQGYFIFADQMSLKGQSEPLLTRSDKAARVALLTQPKSLRDPIEKANNIQSIMIGLFMTVAEVHSPTSEAAINRFIVEDLASAYVTILQNIPYDIYHQTVTALNDRYLQTKQGRIIGAITRAEYERFGVGATQAPDDGKKQPPAVTPDSALIA